LATLIVYRNRAVVGEILHFFCNRPSHDCSRFHSLADRPNQTCYHHAMSVCGGPTNPDPSGGQPGSRKVFCQKFQKELPGLETPPWPGELGQRIYENISAEAWKMWEERMKMILNEYRLMPWQKEAQELVSKHMEDFFFGEGAALPPGYVPQQAKG